MSTPSLTSFAPVLLLILLSGACSTGRLEFSGDVCEIAVRDVRQSREIKRVRDRERIQEVMSILRAKRDIVSNARNSHSPPAGRFNLLFFACHGPVDQLAIGTGVLIDYHANRVYSFAPAERTKLRQLLGLRF